VKEFLDFDPITKISTVFHGSTDGNEYTIEKFQDVKDVVDMNKRLYNSVDERARYGEKMQRVAQIPVTTYYELLTKGIIEPGDPKQRKFMKYLDDIDNLDWRTRPGKLSR
jgi:hypothetical protein